MAERKVEVTKKMAVVVDKLPGADIKATDKTVKLEEACRGWMVVILK